MTLPLNQVITGNCIEVMAGWPENSVDLIVTDPPYGIQFMGLDFDKALPPREAFEQMIRVLKPGALAFVMSSPRQDVLWRMLALLEGVGFNLRTSFITWVYRTGFPKAYDVSAGIDRKLGLERKITGRSPHFSPGRQRTWGDGVKYGTQKGTDAETDWISEPASDLAKQWEGWKSQTGLKPAAECILMVNKPRSERTIVDNVLRWGTGAINVDACRIPFQNEEDSKLVESKHDSVVGLSTPRANTYNWRKFEGVRTDGFTPKGRFPANLLISDGALDTGEVTKSGGHTPKRGDTGGLYQGGFGVINREEQHFNDAGSPFRFFDLDAWAEHHGFLDVAKPSRAERNFGLSKSFILLKTSLVDEAKCKDGNIIPGAHLARLQVATDTFPLKVIVESGINHRNATVWNTLLFGKNITEKYQKDFVPIIKTGINSITKSKILNWLTFLLTKEYMVDVRRLTGNGGSRVRNAGNSSQLLITTNEVMASALGVKNVASGTRLIISVKEGRNVHATCKPVKLMAYLIELGCPPKGIVVDPFLGSGTTCIAAKRLRRQWIGIEINPEYAEIAEARINVKGPLDQFMEAEK